VHRAHDCSAKGNQGAPMLTLGGDDSKDCGLTRRQPKCAERLRADRSRRAETRRELGADT
jgi:hypothetical protein